jgi:hypothetical protein
MSGIYSWRSDVSKSHDSGKADEAEAALGSGIALGPQAASVGGLISLEALPVIVLRLIVERQYILLPKTGAKPI